MGPEIVSFSKDGKRNRKAFAIIFAALFIIFIVAVGLRDDHFGLFKKNTPPGTQIPAEDIPVITRGEPGAPIAGFPMEFILEGDARVEGSMLSNYADANQKLYSATYVSNKDIESVFYDYKTHFEAKNWELTNSLNEPAHRLLFLRAPDGMTKLNIEITSALNEVRVTVSVAKKEPKRDL